METKAKPYEERDASEAEGKGDRWSEMQEVNAPHINLSFVGFEIETLFEYSDDNGGHLSNWYFRRIAEIVNEKMRIVRIKWDDSCLRDGDKMETVKKFFETKWNLG